MSASISLDDSSFYFAAVEGEPTSAQIVVEDVSRLGADGHAFRRHGAKAEPFSIRATATCPDSETLGATRLVLESLQGLIVKYTDIFGETYENLMCLRAKRVTQQRLLAVAGGVEFDTGTAAEGHTCLLVMEFVLQQTVYV